MNITEVRVKLVSENAERLKAFCSVTLEGSFVVRDLKVIDGTNGPFVAMPSRKLADRCQKCGSKNHLRARYCNDCGTRLRDDRAPRDAQGRVKLHADVAHPIHAACREEIQRAVIDAYRKELKAAEQPGYQPKPLEDEDYGSSDYDEFIAELRETVAARSADRSDRDGGRDGIPRRRPEQKQEQDLEVEPPPAADTAISPVAAKGRGASVPAAQSALGQGLGGEGGFASGIL